ncbi:MAG: alpha/beta hydrolase [Aureispira sp.]|nr:alpha/beta hydrolase [Aureispira sp.]
MKTLIPTSLVILTLYFFSSCQTDNNNTNTAINTKDSTTVVEPTPQKDFPEKISFLSLDSLEITAHLYHKHDTAKTIVLCHQARWNKYEYDSIALVLHEKGFNCIATDQRSGGPMGDSSEYVNETFLRAQKAEKPTDYLDAHQDIDAAVAYASQKYQKPVILWGSSYSSTLALYTAIALDNVAAVISFSPGNYFSEEKGDLVELLVNFEKPMFVTSSKEEAAELTELVAKRKLTDKQVHFIPTGDGYHGSRALWKKNAGNEEYWTAINSFLNNL